MLKALGKITFFGISDRGLVRDNNEDYWGSLPDKNLFVLADGMGGHKAGEVASKIASETVLNYFKEREIAAPEEQLLTSFRDANRAVFDKSAQDPSFFGMGTTLDALLIFEDKAFFAHVGDSRIYYMRDSRLQQLSRDHSLVNELITLGAISEEEATLFPFKQALTQAIGANVEIKPHLGSLPIEEKDLFLLCSDGLTNFVSFDEIKEILEKEALSLQVKASTLVECAKKAGGGDNITLILISIDDLPR